MSSKAAIAVLSWFALYSAGAFAMNLTFSTVEGGGGVSLSVVETGRKDGPGILFIHGFSQSYLSWKTQLGSDLADDFRLIAFDLRGHGASGKPFDPENYHHPIHNKQNLLQKFQLDTQMLAVLKDVSD